MARYHFRFGDDDIAGADELDVELASDEDAMCDAARTAAEMLKEQSTAPGALRSFTLSVSADGGRAVGAIRVQTTVGDTENR